VILHAGLVALRRGGLWRGVLIEGPSGAGKSDLAMRCLESGFRLVADDRVIVWASGGAVYGRAPDTIAGLIEARGIGVARLTPLPLCQIALRLRLADAGQAIERLPPPAVSPLLEVQLPVISLCGLEASAPLKLIQAIERLGAGAQQEY